MRAFLGPSPRAAMFCDSPTALGSNVPRAFSALKGLFFPFLRTLAALGCAHWGGAERGCREDELFPARGGVGLRGRLGSHSVGPGVGGGGATVFL